jgi:hypothetical protein
MLKHEASKKPLVTEFTPLLSRTWVTSAGPCLSEDAANTWQNIGQ